MYHAENKLFIEIFFSIFHKSFSLEESFLYKFFGGQTGLPIVVSDVKK